jgi:hypothetical protein
MAPADAEAEGCDHRIDCLEEDVAQLHEQLIKDCDVNAVDNSTRSAAQSLQPLMQQLETALEAVKSSRGKLSARMDTLEDNIRRERKSRESHLRGFSSELEETMRGLIGRIDTGLSVGAAAMRERTEATDTRLRSIIKRVEESLSVSRAAPPGRLQPPEKVEAPEAVPPQSDGTPSQTMSQQLKESFERIREQRRQLNQRTSGSTVETPRAMTNPVSPRNNQRAIGSRSLNSRVVESNLPGRGLNGLISPSLAIPRTVQVAGSGLRSGDGHAPNINSATVNGTRIPKGIPSGNQGQARLPSGCVPSLK